MNFLACTAGGIGGTFDGPLADKVICYGFTFRAWFKLAFPVQVMPHLYGLTVVTFPYIVIHGAQRLFHLHTLCKKFILIPLTHLAHRSLTRGTLPRMVAIQSLAGQVIEKIKYKREWKQKGHPEPIPLLFPDKLDDFIVIPN